MKFSARHCFLFSAFLVTPAARAGERCIALIADSELFRPPTHMQSIPWEKGGKEAQKKDLCDSEDIRKLENKIESLDLKLQGHALLLQSMNEVVTLTSAHIAQIKVVKAAWGKARKEIFRSTGTEIIRRERALQIRLEALIFQAKLAQVTIEERLKPFLSSSHFRKPGDRLRDHLALLNRTRTRVGGVL